MTTRVLLYFLKKCLDKDPNERWTCEQLLRHSYFDNFHFKMPDVETEEFEKLKKYRERSRVSLMIKCDEIFGKYKSNNKIYQGRIFCRIFNKICRQATDLQDLFITLLNILCTIYEGKGD